MLEINKIYNMDCLEGMKLLDDNSVDSIVTDPPYELGFMGKKWDSTGIAYNVELWKECLRVLKPGGHLLAFGGTRTYHRMACAIEDAGFEIRDCIQWLYGTGFPKSHDISKAIDKKLGAEREFICENPNARPNSQPKYSLDGQNKNFQISVQPITAPATPEAQQWDGWGTALKPANEPIVLARKPLSEKTIAENVMKWGTGGINIDGCRIPTDPTVDDPRLGGKGSWKTDKAAKNVYEGGYAGENIQSSALGRFPANVILDEEVGCMLDEQQEGASRFFYCAKASKKERNMGLEDMPEVISNDGRDEALASGNMPHNRGNVPKKNHHPTVKPIKLMEYLITLITPPNGIVLDPFFGSGTTGIAAANLGFNYIGFEISKEYCIIAEKRISQMKRAIKRVEKRGKAMDLPVNQIICGDCLEVMKGLPDKCIDLTVTSPPYDNLRTYNGFFFDFEGIAKELYRITKDGGVVVWVVGDATINGSETGTSFRQALYFRDVVGFRLHDTMIYEKSGGGAVGSIYSYWQNFEYMFVFTKGKLRTFNPIEDRPNKVSGTEKVEDVGRRSVDGTRKPPRKVKRKPYGKRFNLWRYGSSRNETGHPAIFPEQLANDHIISWSNPGDLVLDPFVGSGTTAKMALLNGRNYIGVDISEEYCEIAEQRISQIKPQRIERIG